MEDIRKDNPLPDTNARVIKDNIATETENARYIRIGTWNIRSIAGKEDELIEEFKQANLEILAITETKKKGLGEMTLKGHEIIYSGVDLKNRAEGGVGCVISPKYKDKLTEWEGINERILTCTIQMTKQYVTRFIVVYGPGESDKICEKERFWEKLQEVYETGKTRTIILGDFNARIGNKAEGTEGVMGRHGEDTKNSNGKRLIDFCIQNRLIIQNSFFEHKDCHKFTREEKGRNEKSIIDYILTERDSRKDIKDVRVYRSAELGTDHYLLLSKTKIVMETAKQEKTKGRMRKETKSIRIYKLENMEIRTKYSEIITEEINKRNQDIQEGNLEKNGESPKIF